MTGLISSSDSVISQHLKHYRELLSSSSEVLLSEVEDTYLQLKPLIHFHAADPEFDPDGFNYSSSRLPSNIYLTKKIIISSKTDIDPSLFQIEKTKIVTAEKRRRLTYFDSNGTLFVLINSYSDLDDLINGLLAYRIEYRKIKQQKLYEYPEILNNTNPEFNPVIQLLPINESDFIAQAKTWWLDNINHSLYFQLTQQPVYFVSSNTHSLANIIGGFLNLKQNYIFDYVAHNHTRIYDKWFKSKVAHNQTQINDFLYHLAQTFLTKNDQFVEEKAIYEKKLGIITLNALENLPIDAQIIPLKAISSSPNPDPNLAGLNLSHLGTSSGVIINIQYPLGMAAKYLLDAFFELFPQVRGVYIIGKAAILNGTVGDIQIPDVVLDETTNNVYQFNNIFNNSFPFKGVISQILTHQKSACVYGTLLENLNQIENYRKSNFNIIEMESGHYLASILEKFQLKTPISQSFVYQLQPLPFDFGIINYASDNPLTENLSKESLNLSGIETTYLASLNVLSRIIELDK